MDSALVAREYASHLSDADIRLLLAAVRAPLDAGGPAPAERAFEPPERAGAAGPGTDESWLRGDFEALQALLADPRVSRLIVGEGAGPPGGAAPASPFLVFAVIVHRAATELASMDYVPERTGPRQRVPLFDTPDLRDFLGSPARRLFLTELLASFTRVASGRYRVHTRGQSRTRRFSELDPVRLAGLLDAVPDADRPGVYRRLGDVALFLTGVFPDYATAHALGPVNVTRLLRAARVPAVQQERLASTPAIELLEHLGARWYRASWDLAAVRTPRLRVVTEVADRFRQARRVLNHVADRYLFPQGNPWLSAPPDPLS